MDDYSLITSLVTGFGLALPFGYVAEKFFRAPALVGYILAGLAASVLPGLPPVNPKMIEQLAEIGVMLLMFGVGLNFSVHDLVRVKGVAIPGAPTQMVIAASLAACVAMGFWHWDFGAAVLFGFSIAGASTVVVTKALELRKLTNEMNGQATLGWLVMEDLVSVILLVCLPPFAAAVHGDQTVSLLGVLLDIVKTLAWAAVFVSLMMVVGRKLLPLMLREVARTGSRELFTLSVLGAAIVIAYGAGAIFDVSFALGAFLAGMVMQESRFAHRAAQESLPLQDAFSVLFFVSVGLMLDWHVFLEKPLEIFLVVLIIMVGKMTFSTTIVVLLRWPLDTALTIGSSIGQIGEFSYILAGQGIALKLVDASIMSVIVAASIMTIALNPLLFLAAPHIRQFLVTHFKWARKAAMRQPPFSQLPADTPREMLDGQVIVIGASEVARELFQTMKKEGRRTIVICNPSDPLEELRADGFGVIVGDPTDPMVLVQAHVTRAGALVMPAADVVEAERVLAVVRQLNKDLPVVVLLKTLDEAGDFDPADKNVFLLCEPLIASILLAAVTVEQLVKHEEDEAESESRMMSVRDILDAEYRRSVESVRFGGLRAPAENAEAEDVQSAAAKVAGEAMATARSRQRKKLSPGEAARAFGERFANWLKKGSSKKSKEKPLEKAD